MKKRKSRNLYNHQKRREKINRQKHRFRAIQDNRFNKKIEELKNPKPKKQRYPKEYRSKEIIIPSELFNRAFGVNEVIEEEPSKIRKPKANLPKRPYNINEKPKISQKHTPKTPRVHFTIPPKHIIDIYYSDSDIITKCYPESMKEFSYYYGIIS